MPVRLDATKSKPKWTKTDTGFLRAPGFLTTVGVFAYKNNVGETTYELRSEEEVFHADSMASFEQLPITLEHPPEGCVTSKTAQKYTKGNLGEKLERDGDKMAGRLMVTHQDAIESVESGKTPEISLGYTCDVVAESGVWNGQKYTHRQTNIRGNHVALTAKGRMGPDVRIHMDSADGVSPELEAAPTPAPAGDIRSTEQMEKVTINGVEVEVSPTAAQLLKAERAGVAKADAAHGEKLAAETKRADSAEGELSSLKKVHADSVSTARLDALVSERMDLVTKAAKVIPEFKADGKDAQAIKLEVLAKLHPEEKYEGKSADFIDGAFVGAVKSVKEDSAVSKMARAAAGATSSTDANLDVAKAYEAYQSRIDSAHKKPMAGAYTLSK